MGGGPPEARGDVSSGGTHPNELCGTQSQLVESAPPQDTKQCQERAVIYPMPTSVRMWHKAVFKVGPVAGPKPYEGAVTHSSSCVNIKFFDKK